MKAAASDCAERLPSAGASHCETNAATSTRSVVSAVNVSVLLTAVVVVAAAADGGASLFCELRDSEDSGGGVSHTEEEADCCSKSRERRIAGTAAVLRALAVWFQLRRNGGPI